jgi:hypothetical protein
MDDSTILYMGMFCFAMIGLGMGLTVYEFTKIAPKPPNRKANSVDQKSNEVAAARLVEMR